MVPPSDLPKFDATNGIRKHPAYDLPGRVHCDAHPAAGSAPLVPKRMVAQSLFFGKISLGERDRILRTLKARGSSLSIAVPRRSDRASPALGMQRPQPAENARCRVRTGDFACP